MTDELEQLDPAIEYFVVPPLCPLLGSPYDFSRTAEHVDRATESTEKWIAGGGLLRGGIPEELHPHRHS
jgi:NTE family protein